MRKRWWYGWSPCLVYNTATLQPDWPILGGLGESVNRKMSQSPFAAKQSGLADVAFPIENSSYYRGWLDEKDQIEKHKWCLSEKAGMNVGWHYAQWDWIVHHRLDWLQAKKKGTV
jgi:hypothetical protein